MAMELRLCLLAAMGALLQGRGAAFVPVGGGWMNCRGVSGRWKQERAHVVVWQRPPKGSRFHEDNCDLLPDKMGDVNDIDPERYVPNMKYRGTLKPGLAKENVPMESLPKKPPHREPHFQTIPWNMRWPRPHPAPMTILEVVEESGHLMSEAEELELDKRSKEAKKNLRKQPKMVAADEIEQELMGVDESVFETALAESDKSTDGVGTEETAPKKRGRKKRAPEKTTKSGKTRDAANDIALEAEVESMADLGPGASAEDELLFEQALGGLDFGPLGDDSAGTTDASGGSQAADNDAV